MDWTFLYDPKFIIGLSIPILFTILFKIIIAILRCFFSRREYVKTYFSIVWKKARKLKPSDFLGIRTYKEYYLKRDEDIEIDEALRNRQNVLIIGRPLSGKTRAAYEAIKKLKWWRDILVAIPQDIELKNFRIPKHFTFWRKRILFIDDFQIFVERNNFEHLILQALEKNIIIVATCRSGEELKKTEGKMAGVNLYMDMVFGENMIELGTMDPKEGEKVADEVGIDWKTVAFNGTVGSIFMKLPEMKVRFKNRCSPQEKTVLRAMKDMYECGIFRADMIFPVEWIRTAVEKEGIKKEEYEWTALLEILAGWEFFSIEEGYVKPEEVYFEQVVTRPTEIGVLSLLEKNLNVFNDLPEALFKLGNHANSQGIYVLEKGKYIKIAIRAYSRALNLVNIDKFPEKYSTLQNNLGTAYQTMAEVEEREKNCKLAIKSFIEALKVWSLDKYKFDYAVTKGNIGITYATLALEEEKVINCNLAIEAFKEVLDIFTKKEHPLFFANTQNNLGCTYRILADVCNEKEKVDNCYSAIKAFRGALDIYTLEKFPKEFSMTYNNLGNAFNTLAEEKDTLENCNEAEISFKEGLKVRTKEKYPLQYANTMNNLGNTYFLIVKVGDKSENCHKALQSYEESLEIYEKGSIYNAYESVKRNINRLKDLCDN